MPEAQTKTYVRRRERVRAFQWRYGDTHPAVYPDRGGHAITVPPGVQVRVGDTDWVLLDDNGTPVAVMGDDEFNDAYEATPLMVD
jgi:hypothetical protein